MNDSTVKFVTIHRSVINAPINDNTFRVYVALSTFATIDGVADVTLKTLSTFLGCSTSTARRALQTLTDVGLIETVAQFRQDGGQDANSYRVNDVYVGCGGAA